jgi:hypothetical protein
MEYFMIALPDFYAAPFQSPSTARQNASPVIIGIPYTGEIAFGHKGALGTPPQKGIEIRRKNGTAIPRLQPTRRPL